VYLDGQHTLVTADVPLPDVLRSIIVEHAKPTHEDMWNDWLQVL
jgi:hypothetical protein